MFTEVTLKFVEERFGRLGSPWDEVTRRGLSDGSGEVSLGEAQIPFVIDGPRIRLNLDQVVRGGVELDALDLRIAHTTFEKLVDDGVQSLIVRPTNNGDAVISVFPRTWRFRNGVEAKVVEFNDDH